MDLDTAIRPTRLGGVWFRPTSIELLADAVEDRLGRTGDAPLMVGFVNPHTVTVAASHPAVARHLEACDHVCVDGIGVILALRRDGQRVRRVVMHQAFDRLLAVGILRGRVVVIGIDPADVDRAAGALEARGRGLEVVRAVDGFACDDTIRQALRDTGEVDVVVIGAGTPRSELIAEMVRAEGRTGVVIHAGAGTLNAHAGVRRHPPRLFGRMGLDWLYRYATEPHTRSRYRHGIPAFVRLVWSDRTRAAQDSHREQPHVGSAHTAASSEW
jgi:N-acetylglucosaminyldiphosphoundecaprenol N-acetyl-beta-D-mannosaminyltransferase